MNWEAVGAIAEVLAALAVLVTLIYLALQVRQSNLQGRVQIQNSITQYLMPALREVTASQEYAELLSKVWNASESLSEVELVRIRAYVQHQMYIYLNMYQWAETLKDEQIEENMKLGVSNFAASSGLVRKMMLQESESTATPEGFRRIVEAACHKVMD